MTSLGRAAALATVLLLAAGTAGAAPVRYIVKLKEDTAKARVDLATRLIRVAEDSGVDLRFTRPMALGLAVIETDGAAGASAALAAHPEIEWLEPDERVQPARIPNDEFVVGQTYLQNNALGISAFDAWDTTTGSARTVVAVVDTGYRPHQDLSGRILPGYDFISDPAVANDGDGRDADATDPGDWINAADTATDAFRDCARGSSSWHGTSVAGVIAANSDNGLWIAGIDWSAKILPVRVLGKCGGYVSDIADGVAWAAGLNVPGAPANPNPAQVINLSLGGSASTCRPVYQTLFAQVLATGTTKAIVAAAGNSSQDASGATPANCPGVITVASTSGAGNLAVYSNFGPVITVSAPAGQYQPRVGDFSTLVLSNSGATTPAADSYNVEGGTSFAAPMVSGVIALMLSVNPQLTAEQVRTIITSTAKPFPAGSTCTTTLCGAGIVNASAAVAAAKALAPAVTTVNVVEYYNASLDHYFITWIPAEIATLDAGVTLRGWQRTGATFQVFAGAQPGTSAVCRYYIPPGLGDSHFFGRGTTECQQTGIRNPALVLESSDFMDVYLPSNGACPAATLPVYRVFSNRADANHRYMVDRATRDAMVARGWLAEGDGPDLIVMCVPQ